MLNWATIVVVSALVLGTMAAALAQGPEDVAGNTVVYPAPDGEKLSEDFTVTVAGQAAPVYVCRVSAIPFNQVWPGYQRPLDQTEFASFVYWDMPAPVDVEVISQRPIESVAVRPTARGIQPRVEGNRIRFHLDTPQHLTVEVNGWRKALHVFANPPAATVEEAASRANAPGVRYFGPGIHRPGRVVLQSDETVYVAGGAVVYGCFEATDATDIKILGPGIIDSSEQERYFGVSDPSKYLDNFGGCIHLVRCTNVMIDGPILRDPPLWCLSTFNCSEIQIAHIKQIGLWRYNADGIDICNSRNVTVRDCFVRSFDDSLVVKGLSHYSDASTTNILFERCVVWNEWGRALEIGAETSTPELSHVTFRDCDIVRTAHVAMDVQHGDRAAIHDVTFERIQLEVDEVNYTPQIQNGRDATYTGQTGHLPHFLVLVILRGPWSSDEERGTMRGVVVRDCSITGRLLPPSSLSGFDETHDIKGVTISNLRINGKVATRLEEAAINVGPFVSNVQIEATSEAKSTKAKAVKKDRILFLGNSITLHGPTEHSGGTGTWGMAASAQDKDYVHVVIKALSEPATADTPAFTPEAMVENIADFEREYATYSMDERLKKYAEFKPTLVVLAIAENVPALKTEENKTQFYESVRNLLQALKKSANPAFVVRSSFWPDKAKDTALKRAAADVDGIFVNISKLSKDEGNYARSERDFKNRGIANHPGDKGMKAIADAIVGAIK
jgi:hypothetical protein